MWDTKQKVTCILKITYTATYYLSLTTLVQLLRLYNVECLDDEVHKDLKERGFGIF